MLQLRWNRVQAWMLSKNFPHLKGARRSGSLKVTLIPDSAHTGSFTYTGAIIRMNPPYFQLFFQIHDDFFPKSHQVECALLPCLTPGRCVIHLAPPRSPCSGSPPTYHETKDHHFPFQRSPWATAQKHPPLSHPNPHWNSSFGTRQSRKLA